MFQPPLFFITVLFSALSTFSAPSSSINVCSITINSSEEINLFKKHLGPQGFKFIELTDYARRDPKNWFSNACEAGVRCDILVVSGHFAGGFFGPSGIELTLDTLTANRCSKKCDGILKQPREVFLFGCNTLATKNKDARTPEQYRSALEEDGLDAETISRTVTARYSPLDESFRVSMQNIFAGVPSIHGFYSIAPLGRQIQHKLEDFLIKAGDYRQRFTELKNFQSEKIDRLWESTLTGTNRVNVRGMTDVNRLKCDFHDPEVSTLARLNNVKSMLSGDELSKHILTGVKYILTIDPETLSKNERIVFEEIGQISKARELVIQVFPYFEKMPQVRILLIRFLAFWRDDDAAIEALGSVTRDKDSDHRISAIESLMGSVNPKAQDLFLNFLLTDSNLAVKQRAAIALRGTSEDLILSRLINELKNNSSDQIRYLVLSALTNTADREALDALIMILLDEQNEDLRARAAIALTATKDQKAVQALNDLLNSRDLSWSLRINVVNALKNSLE